jgi:hypothetical protein
MYVTSQPVMLRPVCPCRGLGASHGRGERRFYFKVRGADACQAVSVPMHMNKLKVHGRESVAEALGLTFRPPRLSFSGNSRLPREPVDVDFDGYISLPGPEALGSIGSSPATAVEITPCRLCPGFGCHKDALTITSPILHISKLSSNLRYPIFFSCRLRVGLDNRYCPYMLSTNIAP